MGDDDEDSLQKRLDEHLQDVTRHMDRIVGAKMIALDDQIYTLAHENDLLIRRLNEMQTLVSVQASNYLFLVRQLTLLTDELDALEQYMGTKDPAIARILNHARYTQTIELDKRSRDG